MTLAACEHDPGEGRPPDPLRVLVVDDHEAFREMLTDFLSSQEDIEVVGQCEDGAQVLTAVARVRPDVVLMDMSMPLVDGDEATRLLRAAEPAVRVVVLTAEGAAATERARSAGAHALVSKDEDPVALLRCLRSVTVDGPGCACCL